MIQRVACVVLAGTAMCVIAGCPQPGQVTPQQGLAAGIYSGSVHSSTTVLLNGQEVDNVSNDRRVTESISDTGLPILSDGSVMAAGKQLVLASSQDAQLVARVDSVSTEGQRLVVNYTVSGVVNDVDVTGIGQTTYTQSNATTIHFELTLDYSGDDGAGHVVRQIESQSGNLTQ